MVANALTECEERMKTAFQSFVVSYLVSSMRKDDLTKRTDKVLEDRDAVTEEAGSRPKQGPPEPDEHARRSWDAAKGRHRDQGWTGPYSAKYRPHLSHDHHDVRPKDLSAGVSTKQHASNKRAFEMEKSDGLNYVFSHDVVL
jgi:hypothetical protein